VLEQFAIRPGTLDDVETVVAHRRAMFLAMGYPDDATMERMCEKFRPWLKRKMQAGEYLAWLAVVQDDAAHGAIAAGLGLWLMDWPPSLLGPGPPRANILNVYTRPENRRNGLARRLLEQAIEWCRSNQISTIILHASDAGRPLYESMGFGASNEMRMVLKLD
jgi:GNAT superfamily N-acetyltransferase